VRPDVRARGGRQGENQAMKKRTAISTGLAVVFLVASAAEAQQRQPLRRGSKVNIEVKQTERTRGLREQKPKKEEQRPEITADQFLDIQGKVGNIRREQVQVLQRLSEDTDRDDPELPDLYFRLAELHSQAQRYWRFRAFELYAKIETSRNAGQRNKLKAQQKRYFQAEQRFLREAIKAYAAVANNPAFRNYPKMDAVLFYYAYTLRGAKREELARKVFHKLIQDYPKSRYIADAYLSFADYFFEKGEEDRENLSRALQFYDRVIKVPQGRHLHSYARYKKGWVFLNQNRHQDALETFFQVAQETRNDKKQAVLNTASKRDFVRAYAEVGVAQRAYQAFQRVDRGYAFNMLKILAQIYLDQGKAEKTIYTYRELIRLQPRDKEVCDWQFNVVQAMLTAGDKSKQVDEVQRLVGLYLKYQREGVLKGQYLQECGENAQSIVGELAKIWHNEAIKTLNDEILGQSERLYKLYVESFPQAEDIGEMEYYYAELLWQRAENEENQRLATEKWERAALAFTEVVKSNKVDQKLRRESAYAAVLGWRNALAVDPRTQTKIREIDEDDKADADEVRPRPIPEREQKMLEAFDIYIKYIKDPKDDDLVMMKFLKARTLWQHDHLDQAMPMFQDIVVNHTNHETAAYSINILLDSLIRLHRYEELTKLGDQLLDNPKYKGLVAENDQLRERLLDNRAITARRSAEQMEKAGRHLECGQAFLEIYNANPDGDKMDEVLYNAGVCFEQGKAIGLAIRMFDQLSTRFPSTPRKRNENTEKAIVRMGNLYGAIAHYKQAAEKYEEYARKYGGEADASAALSNAVLYRRGIGDDDQAIKNIEFFVKQYRTKLRNEAADALFGMTGIFEQRNQPQNVRKHLERYLKEFGAAGGRDRVVIAHAKIGEILWQESCKGRGVTGSCIRVERERATARRGGRRRGAALPTQCGPESKIKLTVVPRDKRLVAQARTHFGRAIQAYKGLSPESIPGDEGARNARMATAVYWFAAANFYSAESDYEEFLALDFPTGLDFDPRNERKAEQSKKRFFEWLERKRKMAERAVTRYRQIADIRGGGQAWRIAAAARVGQIFQNFADGLYTAEIPRDVRTGPYAEDAVDAYCDQLTTEAGPLENESVSAFGFCLDRSTELNWFNDWSKLCERELGQIRPAEFPTAAEVHAEANLVAPVLSTQRVITELQ
jgi:TolA-binding protein